MNQKVADTIAKIKHFATGDCSMPAKDRLAVIARLCECIEAKDASESEADKALHALIDAAKVAQPFLDLCCEDLADNLQQSIEDWEALFESQDPRDMGWVGDDGLP